MKQAATFIIMSVLLLALAVPPETHAQKKVDIRTFESTNYAMLNSKAYLASQGDSTLPTFHLGGAQFASVVVQTSDTASYYINVDWRVRGITSAGWQTSKRDTVSTGDVTTVTRHELILKNNSVDYLGGVNVDTRVRIIFTAANNGAATVGGTYSTKLVWSPY